MQASPETAPPPQVQTISFPSNFPVPSAVVCKGDLTSNWEFFKHQWQDYELATELDQKSQVIRVVTFHGSWGKAVSHGERLSPDLS